MKRREKLDLILKYLYEAHNSKIEVITKNTVDGKTVKIWKANNYNNVMSKGEIGMRYMTEFSDVLQTHDLDSLIEELLELKQIDSANGAPNTTSFKITKEGIHKIETTVYHNFGDWIKKPKNMWAVVIGLITVVITLIQVFRTK